MLKLKYVCVYVFDTCEQLEASDVTMARKEIRRNETTQWRSRYRRETCDTIEDRSKRDVTVRYAQGFCEELHYKKKIV